MIVRVPSSLPVWGRPSLAFALLALAVFSCTTSEDTEPYVPSANGAMQPKAEGALISEAAACSRLLDAAQGAYDRLNCDAPAFPDCPGFLRPGAGSGCYEYRDGSIAACEDAYKDASSCRLLAPCLATAELNTELPTCEQVSTAVGGNGAGGAGDGGSATLGGGGQGGVPAVELGGAAGAAGADQAQAGSTPGGGGAGN